MEDHIQPFFPENNQHRHQRTDMEQNVEHLHRGSIRLDTEENTGKQQMPAGRDGQEFSKSLY